MSHYEAPIREPLILGEKSYHDITVDIAKPIEGKANKNWYIALGIWMYFLHCRNRNWSLGIKQEHWMGLGYYKLRLVGWYWSRWYVNLSSIIIIPSKMENGN
jgi:hypothetical protein